MKESLLEEIGKEVLSEWISELRVRQIKSHGLLLGKLTDSTPELGICKIAVYTCDDGQRLIALGSIYTTRADFDSINDMHVLEYANFPEEWKFWADSRLL